MAKGDEPPAAKKARAEGQADVGAGPSAPNGAPAAKGADAPPAAPGGRRKGLDKPSTTQIGELLAPSLALGRDLDEGGEDEEVEEELQAAVSKMLEARAHKAQRKQQEQLQQLQASVAGQLQQLEQAVQHDAAETSAAVAAMAKALRAKLEGRMRAIQELEAHFQKELADKWEEYNDAYSSSLEDIQGQAQKLAAKKASAHKKRLDAIGADAAARLAELEQKFAKSRSRGDQMPNLAEILKAYL